MSALPKRKIFYRYRPQRSWGKVIFSVACVKNSVHREGGLPSCMLGYKPPGADPLGADTSQEQTHPPGRRHLHPLEETPPRADTPQGAESPPGAVQAGRYGQQAGGTQPAGMHTSCSFFSVGDPGFPVDRRLSSGGRGWNFSFVDFSQINMKSIKVWSRAIWATPGSATFWFKHY